LKRVDTPKWSKLVGTKSTQTQKLRNIVLYNSSPLGPPPPPVLNFSLRGTDGSESWDVVVLKQCRERGA